MDEFAGSRNESPTRPLLFADKSFTVPDAPVHKSAQLQDSTESIPARRRASQSGVYQAGVKDTPNLPDISRGKLHKQRISNHHAIPNGLKLQCSSEKEKVAEEDRRTSSRDLASDKRRSINSKGVDGGSMHPVLNVARKPVRLLVASLGNLAPYQHTRHSAGHILLQSLQSYLDVPKLTKSKSYGGPVSQGAQVGKPQWTLFQSPSYMNTSGVGILKAYREFVKEQDILSDDTINALVILHDELETAPGSLKLRRGPTSAKGHNGIKSVQQSLQSAGLLESMGGNFIKLAIGIGRPEGKTRDPDDISAYVLAQFTLQERQGIESQAVKVVSMLEGEIDRLSSSN